jgi:hypothetical protein
VPIRPPGYGAAGFIDSIALIPTIWTLIDIVGIAITVRILGRRWIRAPVSVYAVALFPAIRTQIHRVVDTVAIAIDVGAAAGIDAVALITLLRARVLGVNHAVAITVLGTRDRATVSIKAIALIPTVWTLIDIVGIAIAVRVLRCRRIGTATRVYTVALVSRVRTLIRRVVNAVTIAVNVGTAVVIDSIALIPTVWTLIDIVGIAIAVRILGRRWIRAPVSVYAVALFPAIRTQIHRVVDTVAIAIDVGAAVGINSVALITLLRARVLRVDYAVAVTILGTRDRATARINAVA